MKSTLTNTLMLAAIAVTTWPSFARAQLAEFYIGIDSRTMPFTAPAASGGGSYPDNPNAGRLTLLYNHGDHFHGIGAYRYVGPAATPTLEDTNGNNRLPETYTGQLPLPLQPGSGVYAGRNVSMAQVGVHYSNLELRNVHSLSGVDDVLYNSSGNRWNGAFADADVHLKLLSVSSPVLSVGSLSDPNALPVGGDVHLGEGNEMFSFTPVLHVDAAAPAGHYWAEFQLIDPANSAMNSGRFFIDVAQVPEPGTAILSGLGLLGVAPVHRRRRTAAMAG